ncbi:MAG: energy transducer TonB [Pyrinomonadaceae bacterium]
MRIHRNFPTAFICALLFVLAATHGAGAQTSVPENAPAKQEPGTTIVRRQIQLNMPDGSVVSGEASGEAASVIALNQSGNVDFIASELSSDGKVIKSAPFSAVAITEKTQPLGDGNRITHKFIQTIYRDSEGRTRNELSFSGVGTSAADKIPIMVIINDPVAGVDYLLNSTTRTARKIEIPRFTVVLDTPDAQLAKFVRPVYPPAAITAGIQGKVKVVAEVNEAGEVVSATAVDGHPLLRQAAIDTAKQLRFKPAEQNGVPAKVERNIFFNFTARDKSMIGQVPNRPTDGRPAPLFSNAEQLGTQIIEGVEAEGARSTITIPAGQLGNELPIKVVTERWYSPELKVVVLTKHDDPRTGIDTYRLTNIVRGEPARSLFEVPADYTVKTTNDPVVVRSMRLRKKTDE